jgi:hypothetical protein
MVAKWKSVHQVKMPHKPSSGQIELFKAATAAGRVSARPPCSGFANELATDEQSCEICVRWNVTDQI